MLCMAGEGTEERTKAMVTTTGYCFSGGNSQNIRTHMANQLVSFESTPQEIYGLNSGVELIGFQPPKNLQHPGDHSNSVMWKEFFGKSGGASSSKTINEASEFYDHQNFSNKGDFSNVGMSDTASGSLMVNVQDHGTGWNHDNRVILDDQSLRSCVFPCEGNERPSQGLSLSLGSSYPLRIGLQPFELRQTADPRFAPSSSRNQGGIQQQQSQVQHMMQDGVLGKASNFHLQNQFLIRSSKYLAPAQELLNEFCSLGTKQMDRTTKLKLHKNNQSQEQESSNGSLQSLQSLDLLEFQKRKAKLLQMLEEVDRRYRHYCNQMKAVVASFEAVAGNGAATVYSALASKAMSRHFRCLRDGIVGQIKAIKKALGEKDTFAPGATRGETPSLRILDQTFRQQRAFQQMGLMETHPWRPQRGLPERAVSVLRAWLFEHFLHPYPSDVDKHILSRQTGLSRSQVSNWFINARVRLWKPMVEEMYVEETKENEDIGCEDGAKDFDDDDSQQNQNPQAKMEDQKPTHEQLVRIDSECLSSIINNPEKNDSRGSNNCLQDHDHPSLLHQQQHGFGRVSDSFGALELDFSSYNHNYAGGSGGGVSLTLGLQQHGGGGVSLAFSPASQNSLFYSRDHIEECSPVQYSLLESEGQNLPYRNLMGAQLLHDLAG